MRSKILFLAILAAFLLAACPDPGADIKENRNAEEAGPKTDEDGDTPTDEKPKKETIVVGEVHGGSNHEPPIGTGKGSFYIDIKNGTHVIVGLDAYPNGHEYEGWSRYEIKSARTGSYKFMEFIAVLTEWGSSERGKVEFTKYEFEETQKPELRVWLREQEGGTTPDEEYDIVFRQFEEGGVKKTELLSKTRLRAQQGTNSKYRNKRHFVPEDPDDNSSFVFSRKSAVRWAILVTKDDEQTVEYSGDKDDLYHFYIHFGHP